MMEHDGANEEGNARGVHAPTTYALSPMMNEAYEDDMKNDTRAQGRQKDLSSLSLSLSPTLGSTVKERLYDTSALPDGTTALHYLEAKMHFRSTRPPFLQKKKVSALASTTAILATPSGEFPEKQTKVNIIARNWDNEAGYWTLDLDGKRWIVKNFSGGPWGGARIIPWLGVERGFSNKALAFAIKVPVRPKASPFNKKANKAVTSAKGLGLKSTTPAAKDHYTVKQGSKPSYHVKPIEGSLADPKSAEAHKILFTHQPGDVSSIKRKSSTTIHNQSKLSLSDRLRTAWDNVPQPNNGQAWTKATTKSEQESAETRNLEHLHDETSDTSFETSAPSTQPKRRRVTHESEELDDDYCDSTAPSQLPKRIIRKSIKPGRPAVDLPTQSISKPSSSNPQLSHVSSSLNPGPVFSLPTHKINATTVRVRIPPSMDFVPLSLRSCTTIPAFYASVLSAWDVEESNVATVKVNFNWLPAETMVMRRSPADVFEWFLRTIDEAPCWDEGVKCEVGVQLLLR